MQIASCSPIFSGQRTNQQVGFKAGYIVNIGAGQNKEEGGFNIGVNGKNLGIRPMKTKDQFGETIADTLRDVLQKAKKSLKFWFSLPGGAGRDKKGQYASIPNVIGSQDQQPVGKVYINDIEEAMKKINENITLTVTNDGMMQAYQDMRDPEVREFLNKNLDEGESYIGRFGAGGCGGYTGIKTDKGFQLIPVETGHLPMYKNEINAKYVDRIKDLHTIESYAGCVPAAIRIFATELGFSKKDVKKLSQTVEGRILTKDIVELDTNDPEQKEQAKALRNTKLFIEVKPEQAKSGKKDNIARFQLINPKDPKRGAITTDIRVKGLKAAAGEYFKSIGVMLADGANHLSNTIVLSAGFDTHLAKAARVDAKMNPEQIIKDTAFRNIDASRQRALESADSFNVLIKDTGDPADKKNAVLMGKSKVLGGFRIGILPNTALKQALIQQ